MPFTKLLAFLALAAPVFAATPGAYSTATFQLTIQRQIGDTAKIVKHGATETTFKAEKVTISNTAILQELQRRGRLSAGNLKGWGIVGVHDENAFRYFYARNSNTGQTVRLDAVFTTGDQGGSIVAGKHVRGTDGILSSGKIAWQSTGTLFIDFAGVDYTTVAGYAATDITKKTTLGDGVWLGGAWTSKGVLGWGENGEIITGKITLGKAKLLADVVTMFPDFNAE